MNKALYLPAKMSDTDAASESATIVTALTDNPFFTGLIAELTNFQNKRDIYTAIYGSATYGTRSQKAAKNTAKRELIGTGKILCDAVNRIAAGDREKLLTSGFKIGPEFPQPVIMQPLKKFALSNGINPGEVWAKVTKGAGTTYVLIEWGEGASSNDVTKWHSCPEAVSKCLIAGLTPGTRIWVRATSVGTRGQKIYAAPITIIVQ